MARLMSVYVTCGGTPGAVIEQGQIDELYAGFAHLNEPIMLEHSMILNDAVPDSRGYQ
jgi:hypothetical protein